jgi:[acyl-carrier-protein] S-malonyltransferase
MSALVGLDEATVTRICEQAGARGLVQVANLNSPEQIVVSGSVPGVEEAERLAAEAGAKKVVRLEVSGAFHSALMGSAQEGLQEALARVAFSSPRIPVVVNVDGRSVSDAGALRRALERQLTSPVRWVDCMETLIRDGCDLFVELGPGRVLSGLMRRFDRRKTVHAVSDAKSFEGVLSAMGLREGAEPCC